MRNDQSYGRNAGKNVHNFFSALRQRGAQRRRPSKAGKGRERVESRRRPLAMEGQKPGAPSGERGEEGGGEGEKRITSWTSQSPFQYSTVHREKSCPIKIVAKKTKRNSSSFSFLKKLLFSSLYFCVKKVYGRQPVVRSFRRWQDICDVCPSSFCYRHAFVRSLCRGSRKREEENRRRRAQCALMLFHIRRFRIIRLN